MPCVLGGIGRDKDLFEDPDRFWPERFMRSEYGTKPGADTTGCRETPFTFGGGRVGFSFESSLNRVPDMTYTYLASMCRDIFG